MRATLRLRVRRIVRQFKYPPDQQDGALEWGGSKRRHWGSAGVERGPRWLEAPTWDVSDLRCVP
ncbi:hypothetical protein [Alcaligenes phenolicus]